MPVSKILVTFACLWLAWIALTGSFNPLTGSFDPQELSTGILVAAFVSVISYELLFRGPMRKKFEPKRWTYFLAYIPAYAWAEVKAHASVIYRILHPRMPIKPGIVKMPTKLRSDFGITALANSITMTPGTLSVDVDEKKRCLYVHWINVKGVEPEVSSERIAKPFERFLKRVFG